MGRDYAHKPREPERSRIPSWVYVFTLCAAAAFVGFLYFLNQVPPDSQGAEAVRAQLSTALKESSASKPKPEPTPAPTEQRETIADIKEKAEAIKQAFEFYELLENDEVPINLPGSTGGSATGTASSSQDSAAAVTPVAEAKSWIIQVASFSNVADADKVRAELILNGLFNTEILSVDVAGKGTYHRVMVGPFDQRSALNKAQDILAELNYQPLVKAQ